MAIQNAINLTATGMIAHDGAGVFSGRTITAGSGISVANGDGTGGNPTISADADVPTTFDGDSGSATPAANTITIAGGTGITTAGAGSTITVTLDTPVSVADGGTGQTSYTDGQLLIGNSTGNTLDKASLTGGTGITITNGGGSITIDADNVGDVVGPASATDNAIARYDGTTGKLIQNSGVTISDADVVDGATQINVDNLRLDGNTISSTDTNGNITIQPDGTGNINTTADRVFQDYSSNGGVVDARVYNSDSTAAAGSDAEFKVMTRPEPDGEARFIAAIAASRGYAFGVDDSDSQVFKLTTAGNSAPTLANTELFRMTSAGERTMPLQPAFLGILSATDSNVTGNNTAFTVGSGNVFTEVYDQGGDFVTTGTFTAPVTGRYFLEFANHLNQTSGATDWIVTIVTSNRSYQQRDVPPTTTSLVADISVIADMDAADTVTFTLQLNGVGGDTSDVIGGTTGQTRVSGALIC